MFTIIRRSEYRALLVAMHDLRMQNFTLLDTLRNANDEIHKLRNTILRMAHEQKIAAQAPDTHDREQVGPPYRC